MAELRTALLRLQALSEPAQRVAVFSEWVQQLSPQTLVDLLGQALQAVAVGRADARLLIDVFHATLDAGGVAYAERSELYALAVEAGLADLARLLLPPPAWVDDEGPPKPPKSSLAAAGTPLGTRTWLARRTDRDGIDKLIRDPDKAVIENLLLNPLLTERDVVRLVARRPNDAELIAVVARSPKWGRRYPLRRAIVFNPYTAVDLALRQLAFLSRADLLSVAGDPKIHPNLRDSAQAMATQRPPSRK